MKMMADYGNEALLTDFYQLTMAQGYFSTGRKNEVATFELFYRSNPFDGGYALATGISKAVRYLMKFSFTPDDISFLKSLNQFTDSFLDYLSALQFTGEILGVQEGTVVFPYEPLLQITAPIIQAQLVETPILNIINYPTLIATKASRIVHASQRPDTVLEFGLRRAHGDAAVVGARAAVVGGCVGTSNTLSGKIFGLNVSGTQAHSWIQSFDSELEAFRAYATTFPNNTILLVDTYDILQSGIPNAIIVAKEMEAEGYKMKGIRIDSGDLAWFAVQTAKLLDKAGLEYVKIVLSSDLDEYLIESIVNQIMAKAHDEKDFQFRQKILDRLLWGVGTHLITGSGGTKSALGGVYKLVEVNTTPVIKISENRAKTTNPGKKQLWRAKSGTKWIADIIGLEGETSPEAGDLVYHLSDFTKNMRLPECELELLHTDLKKYYQTTGKEDTWKEAKIRANHQLNDLDTSHRRFLNPHIYKVSLTEQLYKLKKNFLSKY